MHTRGFPAIANLAGLAILATQSGPRHYARFAA